MTTINFNIDDTVNADALIEIKARAKNDSITVEDFLQTLLKGYARRNRIRNVDIESIIDTTGL